MPFAVDALMARARDLSAIDMEDEQAREPLSVLVESLNSESRLSVSGFAAMEARLLRILINRLRMERDYRAHPEIEAQRVREPVFVYGLPRSGTTKLQKVLSATGDFTALPLWMAHNTSLVSGDRHENPEPRIRAADEYVRWIDRTSPSVRHVHAFDTHEPEEANPILEQGFRSAYLPAFVQVPGYITWFIAQPPHLALQYLKRVLKYLQWQFDIDERRPWVLKNPTFLGMEPVVKQVFPDARLLMTHRHPTAIIPSSASLGVHFHKLYSDVDVTQSAGTMMLEGQAAAMSQHLRNRTEAVGGDIIDVGYKELTEASMDAIARIYRHWGMAFTDTARKHLAEWEAIDRARRTGTHRYQAADYGLSDAMILQRFEEYIRRFAALL
ncbi:MAG: sulfotransferase [Steroidobacteraceae bacterium]